HAAGRAAMDQEAQRAEGGGRPAVPYPRGRGGRANTGGGRDARISALVLLGLRRILPARDGRVAVLAGMVCGYGERDEVHTPPPWPSLDLGSPRLYGLYGRGGYCWRGGHGALVHDLGHSSRRQKDPGNMSGTTPWGNTHGPRGLILSRDPDLIGLMALIEAVYYYYAAPPARGPASPEDHRIRQTAAGLPLPLGLWDCPRTPGRPHVVLLDPEADVGGRTVRGLWVVRSEVTLVELRDTNAAA
ncbi:hypothetical protein THAOC_36430, partial [Thalassiosira oceanica]